MNIDMQTVKSNQIAALGYDPASKTLAIQFHDRGTGVPVPGPLYHYANVESEMFEAMKAAESVGSYFYKHIKPNKDKFPYTKIVKEKTET